MVDNGNIIKKVYFPQEILPISLVASEGRKLFNCNNNYT